MQRDDKSNKKNNYNSFFHSVNLKEKYDYRAPDTSEIRKLVEVEEGGLSHCVLPPKIISKSVYHQNVTELWYCIAGEGEIWLKPNKAKQGQVLSIKPGMSIRISKTTTFQFRNTSEEISLEIIIATIPKWPGPQEAILAKEGRWLSLCDEYAPKLGN